MKRLFALLGGGLLAAGLGLGLSAYAHENQKAAAAKAGAPKAAAKGEAKGGDAHADHGDGHAGHTHGDGEVVTIQRELIDTACYVASDGDARGKDHAECAAKCLGSGVPAAVLPAKSKDPKGILFLLTNPRPLAHHAGQTIRVKGTPHPDMRAIDVKSVEVQHGGKWEAVKLDDEHHKMSGEDGEHAEGHEHGDGHHGDEAGADHHKDGGDAHEDGGGHKDHADGHGGSGKTQPKKGAKPGQK